MAQKNNLALLSRGALHRTESAADAGYLAEAQKRENRTKGLMAREADPYKPTQKKKKGKYDPVTPQEAYSNFIKTTLANRRQA